MPAPRRGAERTIASELASQVVIHRPNNFVSVHRYYTSAELLLRQADFYRLKHNDHQLYVFLMRFASLIVETIPRHKDFRKSDPAYIRLRKRLAEVHMPELEEVKTRLNLSRPFEELPTRNHYSHAERDAGSVQMSLSALPGVDWARYSSVAPGTANGGWDLLSGDGLPYVGQQQNGSAPSAPPLSLLTSDDGSGGRRYLPAASAEALSRHALLPAPEQRRQPTSHQVLQLAQRPLYPDFDATPARPIDYGFTRGGAGTAVSVAARQSSDLEMRNGGSSGNLMDEWSTASAPATPPPQPEQLQADLQQQMASGVQPRLELQLGPQEMPVDMLQAPTAPPAPGDTCCTPPPPPETSTAIVHPPSPLEKDFEGVRDVNVSVALMEEFMHLCKSNTVRNIETIGLLGGSLSSDGSSFNITTLIIPKQKGETDRVEMLKEEEIWEIFFQEGQSATQSLFPVGWIHTHPAFDCFLSSVDMHNQFGYQVMLEEAVAIVMSPRDSQNRKCGIFRLTTPGGMKLIRDCSNTGFHSHPATETGQKIYELCGHVYLNPRVRHSVVDLRNK